MKKHHVLSETHQNVLVTWGVTVGVGGMYSAVPTLPSGELGVQWGH